MFWSMWELVIEFMSLLYNTYLSGEEYQLRTLEEFGSWHLRIHRNSDLISGLSEADKLSVICYLICSLKNDYGSGSLSPLL